SSATGSARRNRPPARPPSSCAGSLAASTTSRCSAWCSRPRTTSTTRTTSTWTAPRTAWTEPDRNLTVLHGSCRAGPRIAGGHVPCLPAPRKSRGGDPNKMSEQRAFERGTIQSWGGARPMSSAPVVLSGLEDEHALAIALVGQREEAVLPAWRLLHP